MATHQSPYRSGDLFGSYYFFDDVGDGIRLHTHEKEMNHNIIVLRGAVVFNNVVIDTGQVFDFIGSEPHSVIAIEARTHILNLYLHGIPEGYKGLPDSEFHSTFTV